jgi:hypothetical protein
MTLPITGPGRPHHPLQFRQPVEAPRRIRTQVRQFDEGALREFGVSARHTIAGHLDDMRREASEARDVARKNNEGELYAWLNAKVGEIEQMQMALSEGEQNA